MVQDKDEYFGDLTEVKLNWDHISLGVCGVLIRFKITSVYVTASWLGAGIGVMTGRLGDRSWITISRVQGHKSPKVYGGGGHSGWKCANPGASVIIFLECLEHLSAFKMKK